MGLIDVGKEKEKVEKKIEGQRKMLSDLLRRIAGADYKRVPENIQLVLSISPLFSCLFLSCSVLPSSLLFLFLPSVFSTPVLILPDPRYLTPIPSPQSDQEKKGRLESEIASVESALATLDEMVLAALKQQDIKRKEDL